MFKATEKEMLGFSSLISIKKYYRNTFLGYKRILNINITITLNTYNSVILCNDLFACS